MDNQTAPNGAETPLHRKCFLLAALAALSLVGAGSILPLCAKSNPEPTADNLPGLGLQPVEYFYTGKPYDADTETYTFKYRNYDPEVNRWTTADPSGFPDGANNQVYAPTPTLGIDPLGLTKMSAFAGAYHFVTGHGAGVTESFSDYDSDTNFQAPDFSTFLSQFNSAASGTIDLAKLHDFGITTAVGRVAFKLNGSFSTDTEGIKIFNGSLSISAELYNYDAKPEGERTALAEWLTTVARFTLQDIAQGEPFLVSFSGSRNVTYE